METYLNHFNIYKTTFTCSYDMFYDEMRMFLCMFLCDHKVRHIDYQIINSFCNRCVICYQYVNNCELTICELCVYTCSNLKISIWVDIVHDCQIRGYVYLDFPFKYYNNGILYQSTHQASKIERIFFLDVNTKARESLNYYCDETSATNICDMLALHNNVYPRTLIKRLTNNAHMLYHRYHKTTTIVFLLAHDDHRSIINMLPKDVVWNILNFIY